MPCAWLDLRPTFAGHYDEYVQADGLNPTAAGSQASAEAIAALMRDGCIAQ
jgi:lysophospholipase L1-like esterase